MRNWLWLFLFVSCVFASPKDPFTRPLKPKPVVLSKRIQYLGMMKHGKSYAFVRRVGGPIERLSLGLEPGFGKVLRIESHQLCIEKQKKFYCLAKSLQMSQWLEVGKI